MSRPPTYVPYAAAGISPPDEPPTLGDVLRRYWPLFAVVTVVSVLVGYFVSAKFAKPVYRVEGSLQYTPVPLPEALRGSYFPPSPQTFAPLIKTDRILAAAASEFPAAPPGLDHAIGKLLKVNYPRNTEVMTITLDWPDPADGVRLVDRLMREQIRAVAALKRETVARIAKSAVVRGRDDVALQIKVLEDHAREWAGKPAAETPAAPGLESIFVQRKQQLTDAIQAESAKVATARHAHKLKKLEHERVAGLAQKGAISRQEYERLKSEAEAAADDLASAETALNRFRKELADLPAEHALIGASQFRAKLREYERDLAALDGSSAVPADERARRLQKLAGLDADEFSVMEPATASREPVASTRKTIFLVVAGGPVVALLVMLFVRERMKFSAGPRTSAVVYRTKPDVMALRVERWDVERSAGMLPAHQPELEPEPLPPDVVIDTTDLLGRIRARRAGQ